MPILILIVCFSFSSIFAEELYASIRFSNGTLWEGEIQLPVSFRIYEGKRLHAIPSKEIQEIEFSIEKKEMLQGFFFPEPGKPAQEKRGSFYPVLHLKASLAFWNGEKKQGHLYTAVLYLTREQKTEKLVLFYKMRGKEGEKFTDFVYPEKISIRKGKPDTSLAPEIRIRKEFFDSQICIISRQNLIRFSPESYRENFSIPMEHHQEGFFLAIQKQNQIFIEWPQKKEKKVILLVQDAIPLVQDFFDAKKLLDAWQSDENTIYSLMLLQRKAQTTLNSAKKYPWRLEIWRWKYDIEENRIMLAARQYFFRGILSDKEEPPDIHQQGSTTEKSFKEES